MLKPQQQCPRCNAIIDLNKKPTLWQKFENWNAKRYAERMSGTKMPELKNYYCLCGLHITLIKHHGAWKWVTAS